MIILFYPDLPRPINRLYHVLLDLGIKFHNNTSLPYDVAFFWTYEDKMEPDSFIKGIDCINKGCFDVTKTRVNNIFDDIIVDPEIYEGLVVRKSERQCSLDEKIIICPSKKEEGFVYRKYIETRTDNAYVDYRIFYFGEIKFIVSKWNYGGIFKRENHIWHLEPLSILSPDKIRSIEDGCKNFGFDFGEIDLLKDVHNNNFYVVDLNNIAGMAASWITEDMRYLREMYKEHFNEFIQNCIKNKIK